MLGLEPGVPLLTVGRLWQLVTCISSLAPCPVHVHHPPIWLTVLPPPVAQVSRGSPPRVATRATPSQTPLHGETVAWDPVLLLRLVSSSSSSLFVFNFFQCSGYSAACFRRHHVTRWNSCTDDMISCGLCPSKCESPPLCAVFAVCCLLLFKQTRDVRRLLSDSLAALLLFATSSVRP